MMKIKVFITGCLGLYCLLANSKLIVATELPITLAIHPYLSAELLEKKFSPLASYLQQKLQRPVQVKVGASYKQHIEFIGKDRIDVAYIGPAAYVEMVQQYGRKPLLARLEVNGQPWFQGNIIVHKDSGIKKLDDLKGKRIAYGDPNSTMSFIVPDYMLHQAGVFSPKQLPHNFLYSHHNVAFAVLSGDFEAGAVKPAVFEKYRDKGLQTIARTPKISEHLFISRSNLDPLLQNRIKQIFLSKTPELVSSLKAIKDSITGLVEVEHSDYSNLEKFIESAKSRHQ